MDMNVNTETVAYYDNNDLVRDELMKILLDNSYLLDTCVLDHEIITDAVDSLPDSAFDVNLSRSELRSKLLCTMKFNTIDKIINKIMDKIDFNKLKSR